MKRSIRKAGSKAIPVACALALGFLSACGSMDSRKHYTPEIESDGGVVSTAYAEHPAGFIYEPARVVTRSIDNYQTKLADLPLRFQSRYQIGLRNGLEPSQRPAVREVHMLRDGRNRDGDTLLVIFDDLVMVSVSAKDFTINWQSQLEHRAEYAPVMTDDSLYFIDLDGEYQRFSRRNGRLREIDIFGPDFFPSTQVVSNGSHVAVPTARKALKGVPEIGSNTYGSGSWVFPSRQTEDIVDFGLITMPPVADSEAIYFVTNDNYLYGIDASTGAFRFRKDLGRNGIVSAAPIIQNDVIYVGSDEGVFAFSRAGDTIWQFAPRNERGQPVRPVGDIYAMDRHVFFNTVDLDFKAVGGDKNQLLRFARTTQADGTKKLVSTPAHFACITFESDRPFVFDSEAEFDRDDPDPLVTDEDGNPVRGVPVVTGPSDFTWTRENRGQRVLLKTEKYVFVQHLKKSNPYDDNQQQLLKSAGMVVKDSDFEVIDRNVVQVLDVDSGEVVNFSGQMASYECRDFPFIIGSMKSDDRAIYFVTKDGKIFKGFGTK